MGAGIEGAGSSCLGGGGVCVVCVEGGASLPLLDPDLTSYSKYNEKYHKNKKTNKYNKSVDIYKNYAIS